MRPGTKPYAEIKAARRDAILSRAPVIPKGACHHCAWELLLKGALWCSADCAEQYEAEKAEILAAAVPVDYVLPAR